MATAKLTLIGLYNYDDTLFDGLTLPSDIVKDDFINCLLMKAGEFELLYPSTDFMKPAIEVWGKKWLHTFEKWVEGQKATWNPIENYDRYENVIDHNVSSGTGTDSTNVSGGGSNERKVSGYDSSTYQPADENISTSNSSSTSATHTTGESNSSHDAHIHGNIGVTQASDMLRNWYDIAAWNLMDHMSDLFASEFCITVY